MRSLLFTCALILLAVASGCTCYHAPGTNYNAKCADRPACSQNELCASNILSCPDQRYVTYEPLTIQPSRTAAGRFNAQIIFLADQLERNADRKYLSNTFIITSFVNLNKLSETSELGRQISENLIHELQVRKWQVFEVRMTKDININETGEFSLSRDSNKIRERYKIGGLVAGTYATAGGNIIINARSIDVSTGLVTSSAQARMPLDWFADSLLFDRDKLKEMKIVGGH